MKQAAIIGDIHGRLDMLSALHQKIKKRYGEIPIFSTGDVIDRGPDSLGVIQYCIDHQIKIVVGNHDDYFRNFCLRKEFDSYALEPIMGGKQTVLSYGCSSFLSARSSKEMVAAAEELWNLIPDEHKKWIVEQPFCREIKLDKTYYLTHAGITRLEAARNNLNPLSSFQDLEKAFSERESVDKLIWSRPNLSERKRDSLLWSDIFRFKEAVQVFGHSIVEWPIISDYYLALDTGCGTRKFGQMLSAVILPDRHIMTMIPEEISAWIETP